MEWHLLFLLAAPILVSHAVQRTGGTDLVAEWLTPMVQLLPPTGALAVILLLAMIATPFLQNAPTVLMLGPIAAPSRQNWD